MKTGLYIGISFTYFADYCSLIGLMELAKRFGSIDKVISIFVLNGLPGLLFLFAAGYWARLKTPLNQQFGYSVLLAAMMGSLLFLTDSFMTILLVTFVHGLVKNVVKTVTSTYVKTHLPPIEQAETLKRTVSIRFVIMIFGGTLGAYLGEIGQFRLMFAVIICSYLIGSYYFFRLRWTPIEPLRDELERAPVHFGTLTRTYDPALLAVFILSCLGLGLFMSIEYPLFTVDLGINPHLMTVIWGGHLVGAIVADRTLNRFLRRFSASSGTAIFALAQIVIFGSMGLFGASLLTLSLQILVAAFIMVALETSSGAHLMNRSTTSDFHHQAVLLNGVYIIGNFLGSLIPLGISQYRSLIKINQMAHLIFLFFAGLLVLVFFIKNSKGRLSK